MYFWIRFWDIVFNFSYYVAPLKVLFNCYSECTPGRLRFPFVGAGYPGCFQDYVRIYSRRGYSLHSTSGRLVSCPAAGSPAMAEREIEVAEQASLLRGPTLWECGRAETQMSDPVMWIHLRSGLPSSGGRAPGPAPAWLGLALWFQGVCFLWGLWLILKE